MLLSSHAKCLLLSLHIIIVPPEKNKNKTNTTTLAGIELLCGAYVAMLACYQIKQIGLERRKLVDLSVMGFMTFVLH